MTPPIVERLRTFAIRYAVIADAPEVDGSLPEHAFNEAVDTIEELVEAIREARLYIEGRRPHHPEEVMLEIIDALLAKIGGDA